MSYFLSDKPLEAGKIVELTGDEARHIMLSRRIEIGEIIEIQGPDGKRFEAEVTMIDRNSLQIQALEEIRVPEESPLSITIFQALIKEQPLDFIIQKTTELGADKLVLFHSRNSVDRFKEMDKKLGRWRKIAEEAAKQSGRARPIDIEYIDDAENIPKLSSRMDQLFLLDPSSQTRLSTWTSGHQVKKIGILVGPEGGFTEEEVKEFSKLKNLAKISLGPRILRADTAAISSTAIVQALWGDL